MSKIYNYDSPFPFSEKKPPTQLFYVRHVTFLIVFEQCIYCYFRRVLIPSPFNIDHHHRFYCNTFMFFRRLLQREYVLTILEYIVKTDRVSCFKRKILIALIKEIPLNYI